MLISSVGEIMMTNESQHTGWEKLKILATAISVVITPVIIAWIGSEYNSTIKDREVQATFVELAVSILNQEPSDENRNVREWAVEIINKYSGVELKAEAKSALINSLTLSQEYLSSTRRIQIMLQELGFYKGEIDGYLGPGTTKAIRDFQKAKDLDPDGVPGEKTIKAIEDAVKK